MGTERHNCSYLCPIRNDSIRHIYAKFRWEKLGWIWLNPRYDKARNKAGFVFVHEELNLVGPGELESPTPTMSR